MGQHFNVLTMADIHRIDFLGFLTGWTIITFVVMSSVEPIECQRHSNPILYRFCFLNLFRKSLACILDAVC